MCNVVLRRQPNHNVKLFKFDVDRVIVFHEEDLHLVLQDISTLLNDQVDVTESDVLDLWLGGQQGHQGRCKFLAQVGDKIGILKSSIGKLRLGT